MAWTAPTTRSTGDLITATIWNTDMVNNLLYLHGDGAATIDVSAGGQLLKANSLTSGPTAGSFATNGIFIGTSEQAITSAVGNIVYCLAVNADTQYRWAVKGDGLMEWGTGAAARDTSVTRVNAGVLYLTAKLFETETNTGSLTVPTTVTPDMSNGLVQRYAVTAGGAAALTIAAPLHPPSGAQTSMLVIRIANSGGGTITLTWNAAFASTGGTALPANVANGATSMSLFVWDSSLSKWELMAVN